MTYSIPVPTAGKYTVELHFAEIYFTTAGSRVFNVNVENSQFVLQNIDLFKDYDTWAEEMGIKSVGFSEFGRRLMRLSPRLKDRKSAKNIGAKQRVGFKGVSLETPQG